MVASDRPLSNPAERPGDRRCLVLVSATHVTMSRLEEAMSTHEPSPIISLQRRVAATMAMILLLLGRADGQCADAKLTDSAGATNDFFGGAVAVQGTTAVIGSRAHTEGGVTNAGVAYVYERIGGTWIKTAKLSASTPQFLSLFGGSVSISGNVIVVGAEGTDTGPVLDTGAAYVFVKPAGGWTNMTPTARLLPSGLLASDAFGTSVSISGDRVIASSPTHLTKGAAYIFDKPAAGWSGNVAQTTTLTASNGANMDYFGVSVALSGDTALVGALFHDQGATDSGSVYAFIKSGAAWVLQAQLDANPVVASGLFGAAVTLEGNTAVIGAPGPSTAPGRMYVFTRSTGTWTQQFQGTPSDGAAFDEFGAAVSLSGDRALVGAHFDDDSGSNSGSLYVFERNGTTWSRTLKLIASDGAAGDDFGRSVAMSGSTVLVGAQGDDDVGFSSGSVYVYALQGLVGAQYCFCTSRPCGNNDSNAGCANSTGNGAVLTGCGSASIAADDLLLTATNLPPNVLGLGFFASSQGQAPFNDGLYCVSGPITRLSTHNASAFGVFTEGPGIVANYGGGTIGVGSVRNFQVWYRNSAGPCGTFTNTTNGLSVVFAP